MKITKIEKSKNLTVDIEVSGTHTYQLSNGCVSHNTVSELAICSSGIHPKYSEYYIRRVRSANSDPLTQLMKDQGVPNEPDAMKPEKTTVFSFPVYGGDHGIKRNDMTAIEQLEHQKMFNEVWCDHNVSITVYVRPDEWLEVGAWVYKNWDSVYATSFLPHSDHIYLQAPFEEIDKEAYQTMSEMMPKIDWTQLYKYETEDMTESTQTLACVAGQCTL